MVKTAWAVWKGGIKDGGGTISTETGVLDGSAFWIQRAVRGWQGYQSGRVDRRRPCQLLLDDVLLMLGEAGLMPEKIEARADVTLEKVGAGSRDHREPPYRVRESSGHGQREVPAHREHGQDRVSGLAAAEGPDHDGCEIRGMRRSIRVRRFGCYLTVRSPRPRVPGGRRPGESPRRAARRHPPSRSALLAVAGAVCETVMW